jgi:predicted nucleotidyltransferase
VLLENGDSGGIAVTVVFTAEDSNVSIGRHQYLHGSGSIVRIVSEADERLRTLAAASSGLRLLVLHGSRARGDAHALSDWDFAYEADAGFDVDGLLAGLSERLDADRVDLVDLDRAGALLRYRVARDGVLIFEREAGRFSRFRLQAIDTWCDLAPILEPAYARALDALR